LRPRLDGFAFVQNGGILHSHAFRHKPLFHVKVPHYGLISGEDTLDGGDAKDELDGADDSDTPIGSSGKDQSKSPRHLRDASSFSG
jgi:hypothetical protein